MIAAHLHSLPFVRSLFPVLLCLLAWALPSTVTAAAFDDDFAVVFIDADTEAKLGSFPLDRKLVAEAIDRLARSGAKGVVLKFFYDQPKGTASDNRLADSIRSLPVILQARIDDAEPKPNPLPERFTLPDVRAITAINGDKGWIPLPLFSMPARDVGFVDFSGASVPMLETYQGKTVKSLVLCSLELALGERARIVPGQTITIKDHIWKVDGKNQIIRKLPKGDDIRYLPFHRLQDLSTSSKMFAGKVVILGYDGPKIHTLDTPSGKFRAHRLFVHELKHLHEQGKLP